MDQFALWPLLAYAIALGSGCQSPAATSQPSQPSSAASAVLLGFAGASTAPAAPSMQRAADSSVAPVPEAPSGASAAASAPDASATESPALKYVDEPCDQFAKSFPNFTDCWGRVTEGVREDLDNTVLAERKQGAAVNRAIAALLRAEEKWEARRDARCNAKDNGQMGQGLGSVGQLSVARCRYDADRQRLAAFQVARGTL